MPTTSLMPSPQQVTLDHLLPWVLLLRFREEYPSGISFDITDGILDGDRGIAIPSHISADHEAEDSDVVIVVT